MAITQLSLTRFRSHESFTLDSGTNFVVISGKNGAGKTNILEAISLLAPGRGFRNCKFEEAINSQQMASQEWAVFSKYHNDDFSHDLSTGYNGTQSSKRTIRIDSDNLKRHADILDFLRVIWLTPQMDGIFLESRSAKLKFLDRMSYNFFPSHANTVSAYEKLMRSRTKLLVDQNFDDIWLSNIENQMADNAIIIAKTRLESLDLLKDYCAQFTSSFLKPQLSVNGSVEDSLDKQQLLEQLKNSRKKDSIIGRCSFGTHKSELIVMHPIKQISASQCSTGEQKAMLISLVLAQTKAINDKFGKSPIVLLDDIFAHLDENRKNELIQELQSLNTQVWITTTDTQLHSDISGNCTHISL